MRRGRPPVGLGHIDRLSGPEPSKHRLRVILASLNGVMTIEEACRELGVGEARFHVLRHEVLESALSAVVPRRLGRPPHRGPSPSERRVTELEQEVEQLKLELYAAQIREELVLALPHVVKDRGGRQPSKKKWRGPRKG